MTDDANMYGSHMHASYVMLLSRRHAGGATDAFTHTCLTVRASAILLHPLWRHTEVHACRSPQKKPKKLNLNGGGIIALQREQTGVL